MGNQTLNMILYALALAMSVATFVLSFVGMPETYNAEPLLAIGLFCLAFASLLGLKHRHR